jgi:hypothetical protein
MPIIDARSTTATTTPVEGPNRALVNMLRARYANHPPRELIDR